MTFEEQQAILKEIDRIIFTLNEAVKIDTGDYAEKKDAEMVKVVLRLRILQARIR
jgi:hypothetical protein